MVQEAIVPNPDASGPPRSRPAVVDPLVGILLHGKYRLVRKIGAGGFGTVYEAHDERGAGNRVAIKVLNKDLSSDARLVRAFRAEARRMTRLSHPSIVDWKNFDAAEDGTCYFVMELVEGEELDRVLERARPLPPRRVARILLQILDALRAAHNLPEGGSVLHLDLKPRNVFVLPPRAGRDEQVKVIDFGIGQHVGEDAEEDPAVVATGGSSRLETSALPDFNPSTLHFNDATANDPPGLKRCQGCTPEYVSPEQAAHVLGLPDVLPLDGRSDLYSLGVMAYQMLTGDLPFARPVMRTDYLRLHISGQPRRISASRAKVPRDLARFVERCLAKRRENRFEDSSKAYAAMERIVRPTRALRVGIAALLLVGAAFAFGALLMRGGGRAEALARDGAELGPQNPLFLGPERRSAVLSLRTPGLVDPSSTIALLRTSDGKPVPGSRLSLEGDSSLRLDLSEDLAPGRTTLSVRVETPSARFTPFDLVWLGPQSWKIEGARAGSVDLVSGPNAVDPQGLVLQVALAGEGRGEVRTITARGENGDEVDLVAAGVDGERRLFRTDLGLLRLPAGSARVAIRAEDRAGAKRELEIPLTVVAGSLSADAELCEPKEGADCGRFNQMNGRYLLHPASKVLLRVSPSRMAALEWRVRVDGAESEPPWTRAAPAALHEIQLALPPAPADAVRTGAVEIRLDEKDLVVRTEGGARVGTTVSVPFVVSSERADFDAFLETAVVGGGDLRVPLAEGRTTWVGQGKLALVIERRGRPAMSLRLGDGRNGILEAGRQEIRFPLEIDGEGTRSLEVQSFRFDTSERSLAERPDTARTFAIGVDTIPPELAAPAGLDGAGFETLDALPESLALAVRSGDAGAPLHVAWELEREPAGRVRKGTWAADEPPISWRTLWAGNDGIGDGTWKLALTATDEAGNAAQPVEARFRVALTGPEVDFEAPLPGTWQREPEGWLVQIRARDPNGVEGATCAIVAEGGERLPVELASGAGSAEDRELRGYATIPHSWSSKAVHLEVLARDAAGKTRASKREGLVLPRISPPRPLAVRPALRRGPPLHLVPGNEGAQYFFGGRGDDVEDAEHKRAGLRAFSQGGGARSWAVAFAAGEIGDFYLDEREATRGEFLEFLKEDKEFPDERKKSLLASLASDPELPVTDVTWEEARAFSEWMGKRLPTWVELEYAIRGGPSAYRPFASFHGGAPALGDLNARGLGRGRPWPAGEGRDVTPDTGIRDLSGNVMEWTGTPLVLPGDEPADDRASYFRAKRAELASAADHRAAQAFWIAGGSFRDENYFFEAAAARPRGWKADHVGFRCAMSIDAVRAALERRSLEVVP